MQNEKHSFPSRTPSFAECTDAARAAAQAMSAHLSETPERAAHDLWLLSLFLAADKISSVLTTRALLSVCLDREEVATRPLPFPFLPTEKEMHANYFLRHHMRSALCDTLAAGKDATPSLDGRPERGVPQKTTEAEAHVGYHPLPVLLQSAYASLERWVEQERGEQGELPDELEALNECKQLADAAIPDETEPNALLWLALDTPSFAEARPPNHESLVQQMRDGQDLSAVSLIYENLYCLILEQLEDHWSSLLDRYWSAHPQCCTFCSSEMGSRYWRPFAGLPLQFYDSPSVPSGEESVFLLIGETCQMAIEAGGTLTFTYDNTYYAASMARGVTPSPA